ncbi:MAG: hypothetical protein SCARUB_03302 [Candidatus Scalindua rubra]|uniref:Uncharacterized protein n=1 Tax=Candidatus Scalindua rubra TaxID=1872076 RepID=A0A1E3X7H3_9BACT|nr:MAG: hypothetical protein SCARUB_03302 [Candidatus Scalindua rubra]
MTVDNKIAIVSAIISFISMLIAIFFSKKSSLASQQSLENAEKANHIAIGQTETSLREQIMLARQRMEDIGFKIQEVLRDREIDNLSNEEKYHIDFLKKSWNSAVEGYLNTHEDACGKFLDKKTDPDRFKKIYVNEIRNICDPSNNSYARLMHPDSTSKFEAIWKVYRQWHKHEY